ncbi:hypothetical protein SS05631_c07710 [Sinorhizobium sp. CCBAU 05631]|uniref:Uncharacterized protein n=1 Tax=Sinorhizobium americanum TaxID=194963 RepID=A0A1L3LJZ8_9HYPH|nr:hypothetical protein SAMCFNEI73_Ch1105 [Sinorhizobium americanum]ASY55724.1 hypothetical protein SS05631_c07710 [Sinorhizobium sp. CCBAU 05631]
MWLVHCRVLQSCRSPPAPSQSNHPVMTNAANLVEPGCDRLSLHLRMSS